MTTFKQFLDESTSDKGIMKALFIVGIPGAGKSYTVSKLKGTISPLVVNTDRATEFLSKKLDIPSNDETWKTVFRESSRRITKSQLYNYLNGMLPLFVDGTSNDVSNVLGRAGLLKSIGYDVGMVFVETSLDVALARAKKRAEEIGRDVNPDFIRQVYKLSQDNKSYFEGEFDFFRTVNNDPGELDDKALLKIFKEVQGFYNEPVKNLVGQRTLNKLKLAEEKYLVPEIFDEEELKKKCDAWYRS